MTSGITGGLNMNSSGGDAVRISSPKEQVNNDGPDSTGRQTKKLPSDRKM